MRPSTPPVLPVAIPDVPLTPAANPASIWTIRQAVAAWNATATTDAEMVTIGLVMRHCRLGRIPGARRVTVAYDRPYWEIPIGTPRPLKLKQGRPRRVRSGETVRLPKGLSAGAAKAAKSSKGREKKKHGSSRKERVAAAIVRRVLAS